MDASRPASTVDEDTRAVALLDAQAKAEQLFAEIDRRGLIAPGRLESAVSAPVRDLGAELLGTSRYWHKRVSWTARGASAASSSNC